MYGNEFILLNSSSTEIFTACNNVTLKLYRNSTGTSMIISSGTYSHLVLFSITNYSSVLNRKINRSIRNIRKTATGKAIKKKNSELRKLLRKCV